MYREEKDGDKVASGVACGAVAGLEDEGNPVGTVDAIETVTVVVIDDRSDVLLPLQPAMKERMIMKNNRIRFFKLNALT